jgi:hypothetical protein
MRHIILAVVISVFALPAGAEPQTITIYDLMGDDDPRLSLSLDEAVEQVRRESSGRILSARTIKVGGELIHRIEVLAPGERIEIHDVEAGYAR